ncbi:MAG: hypothetical protein OXG69_14750 [bacterium]|nr:hypothetical protein [bacterium]
MEKEPTWAALSPDMRFIGMRAQLIIWDDAYDELSMANPDTREKFYSWFDSTAETRLEPGGLFILQGQRLGADDLYRHALDKTIDRFEDETDEELVAQGWSLHEDGEIHKYHHLKFKAHYDEICQGDHGPDAKAWPDGCLLMPQRLPWRKLRQQMSDDMERYRIVYQQEDSDPDAVLVNPIWVEGGVDADGMSHPGCWDKGRDLWQLPIDVSADRLVGVGTVDPSPTMYWALQAWAVDPETEMCWLLDIEKLKMRASDLLDTGPTMEEFTGWCEVWHMRGTSIGLPIDYWIVEQNAAQRFVLQSEVMRRWQITRGARFFPHQTTKNKSDPDYGVQSLSTPWRMSKFRLPEMARDKVKPLVEEVTTWTPKGTMSRTDDQVMAQWFLQYHLHRLPRDARRASEGGQHRPGWLNTPRSIRGSPRARR